MLGAQEYPNTLKVNPLANKNDEWVMCIPRIYFQRYGHFTGLNTDLGRFNPLAHSPHKVVFRKRGLVEDDPSYLQIIPYVCVLHDRKVLAYSRSPDSAESRLHGKMSVGIGGHINPEDGPDGRCDAVECFLKGASREVSEETGLQIPSAEVESVRGVIYDPGDDVGMVHVGVLMVLKLQHEGRSQMKPSEELHNWQFMGKSELRKVGGAAWENWSRHAVSHLIGRGLV
jgi:predicted NUDIX family phosphoesterase